MQVGTIDLSKPQTLTLAEKVQEYQTYIPVNEASRIHSNQLSINNLSDSGILHLVKEVGDNPAIRQDMDKDYVLLEGVLHKVTPELNDDLIVAIRYNFVRKRPLIEVPGFYSHTIPQDGRIEVLLLSQSQSLRVVEDILLKRQYSGQDFQYTGGYKIWPGNPNLKVRQIKI